MRRLGTSEEVNENVEDERQNKTLQTLYEQKLDTFADHSFVWNTLFQFVQNVFLGIEMNQNH